ncbi:hypothetical protein [Thiomonas sp. X19]|uniref:hypothetical protein n=1 Tax=Thiomonas sp. X19 TaxID=1050370 RepID=UPI0011BE2007|nr:hypothetical protein [Thiomonas sp. X19]
MDNDKADRKVVCGAGLGAELCRLTPYLSANIASRRADSQCAWEFRERFCKNAFFCIEFCTCSLIAALQP